MQSSYTPEAVLSFTEPCSEFLCPLSANVYDIRFGNFRLRDMDSGNVLFELERDFEPQTEESRFIQYSFPPEFLSLRTIGTQSYFSVGDQPVSNFRIIERHYFKNELLRSYDFNIDFLIPNTVNSREFIYELPELSQEQMMDIIVSSWQTKSDTFFFANGQLIMHVRAEYDYTGSFE